MKKSRPLNNCIQPKTHSNIRAHFSSKFTHKNRMLRIDNNFILRACDQLNIAFSLQFNFIGLINK